jgi:S-adenosylmethionine decarboxylase
MLLKEFDLKHYLFNTRPEDLSPQEHKRITDLLWKEMREIYYGRNIPAVGSKSL